MFARRIARPDENALVFLGRPSKRGIFCGSSSMVESLSRRSSVALAHHLFFWLAHYARRGFASPRIWRLKPVVPKESESEGFSKSRMRAVRPFCWLWVRPSGISGSRPVATTEPSCFDAFGAGFFEEPLGNFLSDSSQWAKRCKISRKTLRGPLEAGAEF